MTILKRMNRRRVLIILIMAIQSFFQIPAYAVEKVTITDIDRAELLAYYDGAAHTLQFGSRLMATMKLMKSPEYKTPAFQALFLAAGTESNNRISNFGQDAKLESAYRKGIIETTQLWAVGVYSVCLPMNKKLSASDIETTINEAAEGPFKQDSLSILIVAVMNKLSIQYPCK
jgi:hypothetical protein